MSETVRLENIEKYYNKGMQNEVHALKGIDICIEQGESVALIGVSGSGKSTLLHIIGAMDKATSGKYFFCSRDVTDADADELAKIRADKIGFVFQQYGLLSDSTVFENIRLALCFLSDKKHAENAMKNIDDVLSGLGILDLKFRKVNQLSGGQKQRVAIARAIIKNPLMIIADEPTGALDRNTANEIIEILLNLVKENGTTLIVATHDMEITKKFDRVIRLENGLISR